MSTAMDTQHETKLIDVEPALVKKWVESGEAVLIDVREDFEHASEHIAGAELHPLSKFDAAALRERYPGKRMVFHCRSGKRSADAAGRYCTGGEAFHVAGGILGWKAAGLATERSAGAPKIDVMRQVQMTAGFLIVLGVALGWFVTPWAFILSAFVGCGLMFAGATGWCGMAILLGKMPWNRAVKVGASCSACTPA